MTVAPLNLEFPEARIPHDLEVLLNVTAEALPDWEGDRDSHTFVPADYVLVYDALCALRPLMPPTPTRFLEWGSGLGIVTLLASALGWQAAGIEREPALVAESRRYAKLFGFSARFLQGSFFPHHPDAVETLAERMRTADLVYVYPWPDQELELFDLFNRLATPGCKLLTYYGTEDIRVFEKI